MTFRSGQKVVCVDAVEAPQLHKGGIYTIHKCISGYFLWRGEKYDGFAVELVEAVSEGHMFGFAAERFRPVVDRPTDISIFQKLLIDKREDISV